MCKGSRGERGEREGVGEGGRELAATQDENGVTVAPQIIGSMVKAHQTEAFLLLFARPL